MKVPDELRVKQVALELGLPFTHVTRLVRRGALRADRPGPPSTWRIRRADLDAYIRDREREAAEGDQRRERAHHKETGPEQASSTGGMCPHEAGVGFCGQCGGQWVVQASGITYAFDLNAGTVTIMPVDVDDDDGAPAWPVLLLLAQGFGTVTVGTQMKLAVVDPWEDGDGAGVIEGWISYISRV